MPRQSTPLIPKRPVVPLDYESPQAPAEVPWFRIVAVVFALLGVIANVLLVWHAVSSVLRAAEGYQALAQNPAAYGRQIAPATIEALSTPVGLWVSHSLLIAAAAFGLVLAATLMVGLVHLLRRPSDALVRLQQYTRLKPVGAVATAILFFWAGWENHAFWVAATRHVPIGSGPPVLTSLLLLVGALLPYFWVRQRCRPI